MFHKDHNDEARFGSTKMYMVEMSGEVAPPIDTRWLQAPTTAPTGVKGLSQELLQPYFCCGL